MLLVPDVQASILLRNRTIDPTGGQQILYVSYRGRVETSGARFDGLVQFEFD
jgi:hypothetical protein